MRDSATPLDELCDTTGRTVILSAAKDLAGEGRFFAALRMTGTALRRTGTARSEGQERGASQNRARSFRSSFKTEIGWPGQSGAMARRPNFGAFAMLRPRHPVASWGFETASRKKKAAAWDSCTTATGGACRTCPGSPGSFPAAGRHPAGHFAATAVGRRGQSTPCAGNLRATAGPEWSPRRPCRRR